MEYNRRLTRSVFLPVLAVVSLLSFTVSGFSYRNSRHIVRNVSPLPLHVSPPFPGFHAPGVIKNVTETTTRTVSYQSSKTALSSHKQTPILSFVPSFSVTITKSSSTQSSRGVSPSTMPQTSIIKQVISSSSLLVSNYSLSSLNGPGISVLSTSRKYSIHSSIVPHTDSTVVRRTHRELTTGSQAVGKTKPDDRAKAVVTFTLVFTACSTIVFLVSVYVLRKGCPSFIRFQAFKVMPATKV